MKKSLLTFLTFAFFLSVLMPVSARAEEEKSEKASGKDAHLLKDLQSGQGSLAIRFSYYELNKGIDLDGLKQQGRSWEQALQTSAKKKKVGGLRRYGTVGILTPQNPDKEKLFKGRWSDTQTYTGDPGNYRLTQAVFQEGRGGYLLSYISRIFQSVPIQKGKLLYLGEINVVKPKKQDPVFIYTLSKAGLEEFRQKYPQSSQYLVSRDLGLGMKTVEQ